MYYWHYTAGSRLDRLVSGVLVIARTTEKAALFHKHLQQDFIEKEYLARVKVGMYPPPFI